MKLDEFLTLLRETNHGRWGLKHSMMLRCASGDCPITAVANRLLVSRESAAEELRYETDDYIEAAHDLGLDDQDAECIAAAADFRTVGGLEMRVGIIRQQLLEATGVAESAGV